EAAEAAAAKIADLEAQLAAEKANVKTVEVPGPTVIVEVPGDTAGDAPQASPVKTKSIKVTPVKYAKGAKPKVKVSIALTSGIAKGKVAIYVNGKLVKTVKAINKTTVVQLPKRYDKPINVKAKYLPKRVDVTGTVKTSKTVKIK
ncbi:MAG: hypothetical protein LBR20_08405, partial [Propionibacteriaceae bacterium]|nr:hypothetical protein [Propionibacteriaceae bacterium]